VVGNGRELGAMEEWCAVEESSGKWKRKSGVHKRTTNAPLITNPAAFRLYSPESFCGPAQRLFAGCAATAGCDLRSEAAARASFTRTTHEDEGGGGVCEEAREE
jgi:hypothetical protein